MTQVPQIKQLIEEANDKTARAQLALAGAESNAKNARDTAQKAYEAYTGQAAVVYTKNKNSLFRAACRGPIHFRNIVCVYRFVPLTGGD